MGSGNAERLSRSVVDSGSGRLGEKYPGPRPGNAVAGKRDDFELSCAKNRFKKYREQLGEVQRHSSLKMVDGRDILEYVCSL